MGWRDRVKKSFADSAYKAEGIQSLKNPEKKEKEGLKTTFIHLTQYTQNTQNPKNGTGEGGKSEDPKPDTPSTVKDQSTPKPTPAQNTPEPSPADMGPEYERIWNRAWELADWIDDPDGATIEARRAKLPELDDLRERMAFICSQRTNKPVPPAAPDPETSPPGTWMPWKSGTATRGRTPENCPARCKKTGKCHALAYFEGKPGRAAECDVSQCSRAKDYKS